MDLSKILFSSILELIYLELLFLLNSNFAITATFVY